MSDSVERMVVPSLDPSVKGKIGLFIQCRTGAVTAGSWFTCQELSLGQWLHKNVKFNLSHIKMYSKCLISNKNI